MGNAYIDLNRYPDAERVLLKALPIRQKSFDEGDDYLVGGLVALLNNLSIVYSHLDHKRAIQFEEQAVAAARTSVEETRQTASERDLGDLKANLADTLEHLGIHYFIDERLKDAEKVTLEAVDIDKPLYEKFKTSAFAGDLGILYGDLADIYEFSRPARPEKMEEAYKQELEFLTYASQAAPWVFSIKLARARIHFASHERDKNQTADAKVLLQQAIEDLKGIDSEKGQDLLADAWLQLGESYSGEEDNKSAEAFNKALTVRRALASASPSRYESRLAETLSIVGRRFGSAGKTDEALALLSESVVVYKRLALKDAQYKDNVASVVESISKLGNATKK